MLSSSEGRCFIIIIIKENHSSNAYKFVISIMGRALLYILQLRVYYTILSILII